MSESFLEQTPGQPAVHGFLHRAEKPSAGVVLTHGAGSNCNSPLLIGLSEALCANGITVLRCDLPFRQARPHGPPMGTSELDQAGLAQAAKALRNITGNRIFLGGHSYGGRMASMLAAREPSVAERLLLLSYPLHPPRKPTQLRTAHFPKLQIPALFIHGTRDPFGSVEEIQSALALIPAPTKLLPIEGAGHELLQKRSAESMMKAIVNVFLQW